MLKFVNDGVTTIKPGHQTTGNARVIWSDESSFTLFTTSGRVYVWRTPKEAYNPECLVPTVKHGGFCDGLVSNIVVFCLFHYYHGSNSKTQGSVMVWSAISWCPIGSIITMVPTVKHWGFCDGM
jgi:hypothetical protein